MPGTQLVHRVEKDETLFEFEKTTDVYCIGSLLKVSLNVRNMEIMG